MSAPITIVGRLGGEPELRYSGTGTAIASLNVVSSGRKKDGDAWVDVDTTWWSVSAFGKVAEAVAESLHKGDPVVIVGKAKQRTWEKDGVKQSKIEVTADTVALVVRFGKVLPSASAAASSEDPLAW